MSTGLVIITSVSASPLNDQEAGHEFTRWPISDLMDYLNQGLVEINNFRPDAFIETIDLNLSSGSKQEIPVNYRLLKSIDAMGASSVCFAGVPIVQCDLELLRTFFKQPCVPGGGIDNYRVMAYAYDIKNPKIYYVSPPVPLGNTASVTGTLVLEPITYGPSDNVIIDQMYITALKFFIAAKAFEVDTESEKSQALSMGLYKKFYNSLGVKFTQETKFNSGTYAGQGGDNQMTKARVP